MMWKELENPMVVGEYYTQPKIYAVCAECGGIIYEGEYFHLVGSGGDCRKVCNKCVSGKKEAVCDGSEP
jgi:hypothetical protein